MTRRIVLIGVGPGDPEQVTLQAIRAMNEVDLFVVTSKNRPEGDHLAAARGALLARHVTGDPGVVLVEDPERDRSASGTASIRDYRRAVGDWHEARAERYADALAEYDGDAGFLVWGDPSLYDSTVRVLRLVCERLGASLEVIPGVSSLSALAARHAIVLHGIGEPVQITTGRRLAEAVASGQSNIAVMLNRSLAELRDLKPKGWRIWWGANLGTPAERLVSGRLKSALPEIERAREEVREQAGWIMDIYLLRRTSD